LSASWQDGSGGGMVVVWGGGGVGAGGT